MRVDEQHHHSGLGMLTPADVRHGLTAQRVAERQAVLDAAYNRCPERFPRGRPLIRHPAHEGWINKPTAAPDAPRAGETRRDRSRDANGVTGAQIDTVALH